MEKQERVRLLLVDGEDTINGRGERISHGAATLVSKWPGYIASAIWFVIFVISVVTLLMLLVFMLLIKEERRILGNNSGMRRLPIFEHEASYRLDNDFCREMTNKQENIKREIPNIEMFNTNNNIFYIRTKPLNKHSACAAESFLKNFKEKNVFIMMFDDYELDYENLLKQKYQNLLLTNVDGNKYLKGTPFKWDKDDYNKSMIAAGLITIWQFGGTVLSDNLVSYKTPNNSIKMTEGSCMVDYELLSCSEQCAAYVYDFMKVVKDNDLHDGAGPIIDKSLGNFCGKGSEDCEGARRARNICDNPTINPTCELVRLDYWQEQDPSWNSINKYCPITYRHTKPVGSLTEPPVNKENNTNDEIVLVKVNQSQTTTTISKSMNTTTTMTSIVESISK